jgi:hypothetical protein
VYFNLLEEHKEYSRLVITKLQEAGSYLKLSKYEFNMQCINFVCFAIMPDDIEMELERVWAMKEWPKPLYHRDVWVFLGFKNFNCQFISAILKIAKLMTDILKGGRNGCFHGLFVFLAVMW